MDTPHSFFETEIFDVNSSGQGVASLDGLKVFIDLALPSERVKAKLRLKKKNYALADLVEIQKTSPDRVPPVCPIFSKCGGCQIMHWSYDKQLEYKTQKVKDALTRIGDFENPPLKDCIASSPLHYRNKIQLPFFEKNGLVKLGLYEKHSNRVVEVEKCFIHCTLGEKVYASLTELLEESSLEVYNAGSQKGFLRHLLIRTAIETNEVLLVFITSSTKYQKELRQLAKKLMSLHPQIKGVLQNVNKKRYNSIMGDQLITLEGRPFIYEQIGSFKLKVSAHAFFQVNPKQAQNLYEKAIELAELNKEETLLDAYCGIGMFSLFASKRVKKVIGIESIPCAVTDAQDNARLNSLTNLEFRCDFLEKAVLSLEDINAAFINPPRKGCDKIVLEALVNLKVKKIIYISCDPATLARDLRFLKEEGYDLKQVQPLDMFPQTTHVESIAVLALNN
ncbi:MAG: 23S rRNA (uracil-C(5))-methyltransferase RlmCD [Chlamydiae bacterium]|nr:23S rRNA (uracil-C(5))-methyltransferase RlmCD [Chlamydiota bacterium]